jgi:hypothetical protein
MTSIVTAISANISNVVTLIKYFCVHYIFIYFVIYLEASAVAQTVSHDRVISEKCIVKVVKERYFSVDKINQLDVNFVFFISLLIVAQHVSDNHVPIIRS